MNESRTVALLGVLGVSLALLLFSRTKQGEQLAVDAVDAVANALKPLGIRNNNPGNLRWDGTQWQGLADPPKDSKGYLRFADRISGLRAAGRDLRTKYNSGLRTVRQIISKYAPPIENDTASYINAVCKRLRVQPDDRVNVPARLEGFLRAVVAHENGTSWENHYSAAEYAEAVKRALA